MIVFILWPYYNYSFRFDPQDLFDKYIDRETPASLSEMHRALALRIKQHMAHNWRIIQPMRVALQVALIVFLLEILVWLFSIAGMCASQARSSASGTESQPDQS